MLKFWKRRSPARKVVQLSRPDIADLKIAAWHDLSEAEWTALPAIAKVDHREHYYRAMGMAS